MVFGKAWRIDDCEVPRGIERSGRERRMIGSRLCLLFFFFAILRSGKTQQRGSGAWRVIEGYDHQEPRSLGFSSLDHGNFSCAPVQCSIKELDRGYGYFMAATSHSNTFEMLVFRVCRFLQTCIRHTHIFVTLHHTTEEVVGISILIYPLKHQCFNFYIVFYKALCI